MSKDKKKKSRAKQKAFKIQQTERKDEPKASGARQEEPEDKQENIKGKSKSSEKLKTLLADRRFVITTTIAVISIVLLIPYCNQDDSGV